MYCSEHRTIIAASKQLIMLKLKVVKHILTLFILMGFPMFILKYWYSFKLVCQPVEYLHAVET